MTPHPYLKWLRIAFSVTCGIACVLLVVLWVRSYSHRDSFTLGCEATGGIAATSLCGIMGFSYHAEFRAGWGTDPATPEIKYYWQHFAGESALIGFGVARFPHETALLVPHWFQITLFAFVAALPWISWRFSLGTLLIGMTVVAVLLGAVVWVIE